LLAIVAAAVFLIFKFKLPKQTIGKETTLAFRDTYIYLELMENGSTKPRNRLEIKSSSRGR
jgi:hypothetical protein